MKFKTTIILLAVFIALLVFISLFEFKGNNGTDEEEKLVALPSEDVRKITIKKEDDTFTFHKNEEGEWLISEPVEAKADTNEVSKIAEDFSDLKIERVVEEEPQDLQKYDIPQKELHLWFKDKDKPVKLLIGMENPLDSSLFAKRADEERVVLIPSHLKSLTEKNLFDFRKKDIFQFETDDVKNIKLLAKKIQWEATKEGEEWFFTKPIKALAKESKINDMLFSFSSIKAKEFVSEEKNKEEIKKYGLDHPEYEITLIMPVANQEVTFFLHKEDDKLYTTTTLSSKIVSAEDAILSDLEKKAEELREDAVASFHSWEVNRLYLKKGSLHFTVKKDEEANWHFDPPNKGKADNTKIQAFIRKIESTKATEFIDPPLDLNSFGLSHPQDEIKIWTEENEEKTKEIRILIGLENKETKQVVLKNARFDYLFRVDATFLEEFPKDINDWKKQEEEKKEKNK